MPSAGVIAVVWLIIGFFYYLWLFNKRAQIVDAVNETVDPDLLELRGRSPLVLLPIGNPQNTRNLIAIAACLMPQRIGRVLLLNVLQKNDVENSMQKLDDMSSILTAALDVALHSGVQVESMVSIAENHWLEIVRVSHIHRCSTVLMGLPAKATEEQVSQLERTFGRMNCHVGLLRLKARARFSEFKKILIPIGGNPVNNALRARLLNSMKGIFSGEIEIVYLLVLPEGTSENKIKNLIKVCGQMIRDETTLKAHVDVRLSNDVCSCLLDSSKEFDLVLLGLNRSVADKKRRFGQTVCQFLYQSDTSILVIGQGD